MSPLFLVPLAVVVCAISLGIPFAIFAARKKLLRGLGPAAVPGLRRMTEGLFEDSPSATSDSRSMASIQGLHLGEPLEVRTTFSPNANHLYVRSGLESAIGAELAVTVSLRGATPRLSFVAKRKARRIADAMDLSRGLGDQEFARVWNVDVEEHLAHDVLDDELRAELMRFVAMSRNGQSVAIGPRGLTITWFGDGAVSERVNPSLGADARHALETAESVRVRAATDLALRLRKRILESIERRAHSHVRIGAYRR